MVLTLNLVSHKKGFKNLQQTNILYFVLKPFLNKKVFTLTQALSQFIRIEIKFSDHTIKMCKMLQF